MIIIEHATTARARMPRRCRRAAHRSSKGKALFAEPARAKYVEPGDRRVRALFLITQKMRKPARPTRFASPTRRTHRSIVRSSDRLDYPRTPGASRARVREDPSRVAAMACWWGDVLSKTTLAGTGPRRQQDSTLVRPRPRLIAHREPKKNRFHPQVLAVTVSLDRERTERSSNSARGLFVVPARCENC